MGFCASSVVADDDVNEVVFRIKRGCLGRLARHAFDAPFFGNGKLRQAGWDERLRSTA